MPDGGFHFLYFVKSFHSYSSRTTVLQEQVILTHGPATVLYSSYSLLILQTQEMYPGIFPVNETYHDLRLGFFCAYLMRDFFISVIALFRNELRSLQGYSMVPRRIRERRLTEDRGRPVPSAS